jgi:uncharacterized protein (DUF2267 family)
MSMTGLDVFDTTVHKTNAWLKDLMDRLRCSRHDAYIGLRATLHALRDRLPVEEVVQLGAQVPMLVRGFYYEGWDPTGKPVRERSLEGFLAGLALELPNDMDPAAVAGAVFALLADRVTAGEIEDVEHVLPARIRDLWPRKAA